MDETYTDAELLALMREDRQDAFELLYLRYWLSLYDAAYQRLKNIEQSEDIVQEIFLKFWARRHEVNIENLPVYLHMAVRYSVYNLVSRGVASKTFYQPLETVTSLATAADAKVIEMELHSLIFSYINTLPKKRRLIFTLHFEENLSTKEIASRLNISQKTVQNQLGAVVHGLRTKLTALLPLVIW